MDQLWDSDLLVSVFMKRKATSSTPNDKLIRKVINQKGSSSVGVGNLRTGLGKRNWFTTGPRTVLSWLIHSRAVSLNEVIQIRSPIDGSMLKEGIAIKGGLVCLCCYETLSIIEFWRHASLDSKWPSMNLFMESGKPFILCQLEAWSAEYKARKASIETSNVDDHDCVCGICGGDGSLVCCEGCPVTVHRKCLPGKIPKGNWYCFQCRCWACSGAVTTNDLVLPSGMICSLCKHRYHRTCMNADSKMTSYNWFCGENCHKIYTGLQARIGLMNNISDDLSWRLLCCIDGDLKAHSSLDFMGFKAECNSKLAVAVTLLEEYMDPMVDPNTQIDMIPQAIFNQGCRFPRLNFEGFYTVVLEKNDTVVSVASIRVHGKQFAELPFVATCRKFRNQGMCRILVNCIEEMLRCLKIEKLLLPASSDDTMELWMSKFGFELLEENEKAKYVNLILLPESHWLVKTL